MKSYLAIINELLINVKHLKELIIQQKEEEINRKKETLKQFESIINSPEYKKVKGEIEKLISKDNNNNNTYKDDKLDKK